MDTSLRIPGRRLLVSTLTPRSLEDFLDDNLTETIMVVKPVSDRSPRGRISRPCRVPADQQVRLVQGVAYPGDWRPKPIAFPDPATTAIRGDRFALLPLARFLELKLASGMTAPHRLHDLADVLDLIRTTGLAAATVDDLHPWVREKFRELWEAAQGDDGP
jgi:hypothetical protein